MLSLNFHPFPTLSTARLDLRRTMPGDAPEVFFLRSDPQMLQYLDREPARSIEDATKWIAMIDDLINGNESVAWAIAMKNERPLIGTITLWNIKKEHYRAEIGYAICPPFQGKGLMHEALAAVLDYAFSVLRLHSIEANVNPANKASIRLLERNNFVREAYHRENYYYNGRFLDSAIYSLLTPYKN